MGPSLEDLFNKCARKFSLKTVLQIADQLLERVDTLHARHLIHRDIKPANFVIGIGDQGANVYCVDFGLSKRYRHPKNLQHIPHRDGRSLTGTPRYASINNHLGIEQSRRDDLEAIAYILIYFLKGSLPWQGLKAKNASKKYLLILSKKQSVSIAQLCQGCPSQFAEFLAYSRSLKFDAKPDIPYLRKIFRDLYNTQGCPTVGKMWDWDAFDSDYLGSNTPGSGGGVGVISPPPILQTGLQQPLRPSTTAAVANPRDYSGLGTGTQGGLLTSRGQEGEDGTGPTPGVYGLGVKKSSAGAIQEIRPSTLEIRPSTSTNTRQASSQHPLPQAQVLHVRHVLFTIKLLHKCFELLRSLLLP
jgi:serine/threonine protein kinase